MNGVRSRACSQAFSVVGVVALGIYFVTTDTGMEKLHLNKLEDATRAHALDLLTVTWVSLIAIRDFADDLRGDSASSDA